MGCADGVVVQESISTSFTPYLGQWLNLHPAHRHSYIGLLKFGVFPQGLKGYKGLFTSVFNLANQQGILDGVPVRVCVTVCVCVTMCVPSVCTSTRNYLTLGMGRIHRDNTHHGPRVLVRPRGLSRLVLLYLCICAVCNSPTPLEKRDLLGRTKKVLPNYHTFSSR